MNPNPALSGREGALSVLEQYRHGKSIAKQASDLGMSTASVYQHILRHVPELFLECQAATALSKLDTAEQIIVDADSNTSVSRGRELARLAMWTLERAARKWYGADAMQVTINNIALDPAAVALQVSELEERLGLSQACHAQPLTLEHEANQALVETV